MMSLFPVSFETKDIKYILCSVSSMWAALVKIMTTKIGVCLKQLCVCVSNVQRYFPNIKVEGKKSATYGIAL